MSRFEQDTIKRQIQQLAEVIAAIVARVRVEQDWASGLEAIRAATARGLGPDRSLLDRLDPDSVRAVLRQPERVELYAQACETEAGWLSNLGRADEAALLSRRAAELRAPAPPSH